MNSKKTYDVADLTHWPRVAKELIHQAGDTKVWCMIGDLGAGKTTLVRALVEALGSKDQVSSPTFALVNTYIDKEDNPIYHVDLYRLEGKTSYVSLDLDLDYITGDHYCFIEWAEHIIPYLAPPYLLLNVATAGAGRQVTAEMITS